MRSGSSTTFFLHVTKLAFGTTRSGCKQGGESLRTGAVPFGKRRKKGANYGAKPFRSDRLVAKELAMTKKYTGQCACGAVKFEFDTNPTFVAVCHCLDCKKASGGEAATFFGVPEDDFTLISGEPKA